MVDRIYMDYNASTPIAPEVKDIMMRTIDHGFGNPSALHWAGMQAKEAVEKARKETAALIGASPEEIVFTSGGTESNNHVLKGIFESSNKNGHIITSMAEHPAVQQPCRHLEQEGANVTFVGTDSYGRVNPADIEAAITENTVLISIMHANNEVGSINPIADIAGIAHRHNIVMHTDAAQSIGKIPVHVNELGIDFLSIAGHKLYAPKGIGALYIRKGRSLPSFMHGAGHERGRRAGTENVIQTAALGKAAALAAEADQTDCRLLRDEFWSLLHEAFGEQIVLNGHPTERLPNTLHVSFNGFTGEELLTEIPELAASTGAACHSGSVTLSPALDAMGVDPAIGKGSIRFSLGAGSTKKDIYQVTEKLKEAASRLS